MRILYGVQTTGRGHLVRSRAMITALKARGHHVDTLFSGPPVEPVWLDSLVEPWTQCEGLTHVSIDGRISYLASARRLRPFRFLSDVRQIDARDIDLVISDYEPITVRVAKRERRTSLGIGHLYAYAHPIPIAGRNRFNHAIMRRFAPVDVPLGLHWYHFGQPVLPPMIMADVPDPADASDDGPVLVYLSFESLDAVVRLLAKLGKPEFRIYAGVEEAHRVANVEILPISRTAFITDLSRAAGVICNAGFSLISEALHLGKRVLAKPVHRQTEQESNAESLKQLGLATVCHKLDAEIISAWLSTPAPEPMAYPDILEPLLDWIEAGRWNSVHELVATLWSRTRMPPGLRSTVNAEPARAQHDITRR